MNPGTEATRAAAPRGLAAAMIASALLAAVIYGPSIGYSFTYDDVSLVAEDARLAERSFGWRVWVSPWWPRGSAAAASRPLTTFTFWAQVQLHGRSPGPFHAINVLLAMGLAAMTALAAGRWLGSAPAAWVCGLIAAAHPLHVEAVANIVGRAELLAGLFVMAALVLWLQWRAAMTWRRAGVLGVLILLAGLSKEHGYLAAPMLLILQWADRRVGNAHRTPCGHAPIDRGGRCPPYALFVAITVVACIAVAQRAAMHHQAGEASRGVSEIDNPLHYVDGAERWVTPLKLLGRAAALLVVPIDQSPDYSPRVLMPTASFDDPLVLLGAATAAAWLFAVAIAWRHRGLSLGPLLMLPLWWFIPSNSVMLIGTIFAERLLTMLSLFTPIALCAAGMDLWRWERVRNGLPLPWLDVALAGLAIVCMAGGYAMTWMPWLSIGAISVGVIAAQVLIALVVCIAWPAKGLRIGEGRRWAFFIAGWAWAYSVGAALYAHTWKDQSMLVLTTTTRHPESGRFQGYLAFDLMQRGVANPDARSALYPQAERAAKLALEYWPRQFDPYAVLAVVAHERGDQASARWYAQYAARGQSRQNLGDDVLRLIGELPDMGELERQAAALRAKLEADPNDAAAMRELARTLARMKRHGDAVALYDRLIGPDTTDTALLDQAVQSLLAIGAYDRAMTVYHRWLAIDPDNWSVLNDAAAAALIAGGDFVEAKGWLDRAMRLSPGSAEPWATLGQWHESRGETSQAADAYREALRRSPPSDPKRPHYQLLLDAVTGT